MCNTKVWWYIGVEITKFEISCHHTSCKFWIGPFHQQPHLVLKFIFLFYHQYVQYILSLGLWSWIKGKGNKSLKEKNPEWILLSNPQLWHFGMLWYQFYLGLHNVNMKNTWYPQKNCEIFLSLCAVWNDFAPQIRQNFYVSLLLHLFYNLSSVRAMLSKR